MSDIQHSPEAGQAAPLKVRLPHGFPTGPVLAIGVSAALAAWMYSAPAPQEAPRQAASAEASGPARQAVRTISSEAQPVVRRIVSEGESRPLREGHVTPRISGVVSELLVGKGEQVEEGQPIVTLEVPGFGAQEREARAKLDEARRDLDKIENLSRKGLATEDQMIKARTSLAGAEASWASIEETRADMVLRAPFSGVINSMSIEIGDNVSPGSAVAGVLDMSQLVVGVSIPQAVIGNISVGQAASVALVTGEVVEGEVSYVSAVADSGTRSFPVEIQIANADHLLKAGVSASVSMDGPASMAHSVPSAYLSLEASGNLSVKLVQDGVVEVREVEIVSSGLEEVQVTGLPERAEIITVGQGFVQAGDMVRVGVVE